MMSKFFVIGMLCTAALAVEKPGDDPLQWLRDSIPGEPGTDYPIYNAVESTAFSCEGRVFGGYYADPELQCQAYHVCLLDPNTGSMFPTSFLCPNGTLFQQQIFNCDWWYNVDCSASESFYGLAENAFGNENGGSGGSGGGQCPNANPLSDAECEGQVSNCWSPGQTDTDCPNFGLCCFDGCANTCVDSPQVQSDSRPVPQTTPGAVPLTTPRPAPVTTGRPIPVTTTTGYDYPVPEVTLPIRPVTTTLAPVVITSPSALYGAPPPGAPGGAPRRQGKSNNGRRGKRQGRRVRVEPAQQTEQ